MEHTSSQGRMNHKSGGELKTDVFDTAKYMDYDKSDAERLTESVQRTVACTQME